MDRRQFIAGSATALAIVSVQRAAAQSKGAGTVIPTPGDARLTAAFDAILAESVRESPEFATQLGLDKGANADLRGKLDDNSAAARVRGLARTKAAAARLRAIAPDTLSPQRRVDREVVLYSLDQQMVGPERFKIDTPIRPYRITQQAGVYFDLPDFLDSTHPVQTRADAEAYLSRLGQMGRALDNDTAVTVDEATRGLLAPDFSLDLALGQMRKLRAPAPADHPMVASLVRRAGAAKLAGDWRGRAAALVERSVYPALDRQIAAVERLRGTARSDAGLAAVPNGAAIYAAALAGATTTNLTPAEVHRMGLEQVADLTAQLDTILKSQGYTTGTVGERLAKLNVMPDQLYANTAAGRTELIGGLNDGIKSMYAKLPQAFSQVPTQPLEIRAVPVEIEDGAANGYYNRASLDGSRPAIYFVNLKDVGDWPKYTLPSLTYHEGVPGHHLQISLAQESKDIPTLRKIGFFSAYSEGWALYAEQLADELGAYASPLERAGYLQSFLFRATRLVVDTGIHAKRWSREKATDYMVATTGFARPRTQREVERYCTQAGQACSYKVGHMAWTRARVKAKAALGDRFDLKQFHDILKEGAMPLTILERRVDERIAAIKTRG